MKRIMPALLCLFVPLLCATALAKPSGFTIGTELRYATTLDDMTAQREEKYDITLEDYPFFGEAGFLWRDLIPKASLDTSLIVGARAGVVKIVETESPDHDTKYALSTVPFGAFARLEGGIFYLDAGLGAHRWNLEYTVNGKSLDNTGYGLSASISSGVRAVLFDHVVARTAAVLSYYGITDIGTGVPANSLTAALVCGINLR